MSHVRFASRGPVGTVTLDHGMRKNALSSEALDGLEKILEALENGSAIEIVVFEGAGDHFCAGVDLALIEAARPLEGGLAALAKRTTSLLARVERLPQISVACMNGPALGLGVHLTLSMDYVLAQDGAYLWLPEARMGFPDVLHLPLLQQRLGRAKALDFVLGIERLSATEAATAGLVHETCKAGELAAKVEALTAKLLGVPAQVRRMIKKSSLAALPATWVDLQLHAFQSI